jgi:hypothetical protein
MEKKEKVFADGFIFKRSDNAPDFVIGNISIKSEDAIAFIQKHSKKGWVNLKVNKSQNGKAYIELDTWEATGTKPTYTKTPALNGDMANEFNNSDLPF